MTTCEQCGASFGARSSRARFCSAACRSKAWRERSDGPSVELLVGVNAEAVEGLLSRVDGIDPATVQAARSLAVLVDSKPGDSGLWSRYLSVLAVLRESVETQFDDALMDALAEIRAASSWPQ